MDNIELRKLLSQLHEEIKNTPAVDEKGVEVLRDLEGDINALLARSEKAPVQMHPTGTQTLENAIRHFEVTQPGLTALISKLLDTLSNAGI